MIKAILNGILKMVTSAINLVLTPVNALFANIFPNMSSAISTFNTFVTRYLGGTLSYFFSLFPPIFRNLLVIWFGFVVAYYGIYFTFVAVLKIWNIIQKIKFW